MTATTTGPAARTVNEPTEVVKAFLLALAADELDRALGMLADDIEYTNVSLPTIRGRATIERIFRPLSERLHGGFRVHFHTVAADGTTVLTERTDALVLGPVEQRFWVYGRFEVVDGQITVWRDSFDWFDLFVGLVRGLAGAFVPALNRRWPSER
jgi:limonene-1,2-epoxide hydrolase